MSRYWVASRLARREAVRRPVRSALVVALVALPVAAMTCAVVLFRTGSLDPEPAWQREYGAADLVVLSAPPTGEIGLPRGARSVTVDSAWDAPLETDAGRVRAHVSDLPLTDPLAAGIIDVVEGRPPGDGEVLLSPPLARSLGLEVGDEVAIPPGSEPLRVAGIGERPGCLSCRVLVTGGGLPPEALLDQPWMARDAVRLVELGEALSPADIVALVETGPGTWLPSPELVSWQALPFVGVRLADMEADQVRWAIVLGGVALTVAGIVISSAFAVGARRQLVTLGQLAANGAPPSVLRASLVLQGTWAGLVGVLTGLALAVAVLAGGRSRIEHWVDQRLGTYDARPRDLAIIAAVGLAAATVAALVPARSAARTPTLHALAGRRPLPRVSSTLTLAGLAAVATGLGLLFVAAVGSQQGGRDVGQLWAYVALLGGVVELLGACAVAPALVARLEPLAARLRGSLRLAARSLARQRARTGAVVSAVAAAGALAVTSSALIQGFEARAGRDDWPRLPPDAVLMTSIGEDSPAGSSPPPADAVDQARSILPGATVLPLEAAVRARGTLPLIAPDRAAGDLYLAEGPGTLVVADPDLVDALALRRSVREALERDGFVLAGVPFGVPGEVRSLDVVLDPAGAALPGIALATDRGLQGASGFVLPELLDELGLEPVPWGTLLHAPEPLTGDQRWDLQQLAWGAGSAGSLLDQGITMSWGSADEGPRAYQLQLLLTAFALTFALFVVAAGLALVAADSRDERDVLTVAGAPPRRLARSAGAKAWLLSVLGGVMAVPVGFLPVVVFARAHDGRFPLVFPTGTVAILVLAAPVVAAAGALATSGSLQRLRPVRVSTATFE